MFGFLNDLLTPAVRFSPWATPLLGPIAPMVSSDGCRGLTGIPVTQTTSVSAPWPLDKSAAPYTLYSPLSLTFCCASNQSEFVLLISNFLLLNISSWEEKSHHSFEELVLQLDSEWHHIHLIVKEKKQLKEN
uniref:Uncharacterized protein n=1 Tax=Monopterus albus TaxID=43700 RepID=A0A3Q3R224_MONAL